MKKTALILLLFIVSTVAFAGVNTVKSKYIGNQIFAANSSLVVQDDFFNYMLQTSNWQSEFTNRSVKNRVRFLYTESEMNHAVNTGNWTATVTFDVKVRDENNVIVTSLTNQTLTLSNDGVSAMTADNEAVFELVYGGCL